MRKATDPRAAQKGNQHEAAPGLWQAESAGRVCRPRSGIDWSGIGIFTMLMPFGQRGSGVWFTRSLSIDNFTDNLTGSSRRASIRVSLVLAMVSP